MSRTVSRATLVDGASSSDVERPARAEMVTIGILRACTGSTTAYDSIRASVAEMVDDDEDQEELSTPMRKTTWVVARGNSVARGSQNIL